MTGKKTDKKPTKKANGEGSVQKYYKNGIFKGWRCTVTVGRNDSGKLIRKQFYGKSKMDAINSKKEYLNKSDAGILPSDEKITLQQWIKTWLYEYRINDLRPSSLERYCGIYRNYILNSKIGMRKLKDLKTSNLQAYYNSLVNDSNKSPCTIKSLNKLLKTGLNQAVKENYIIINPCNNVILPKLPPKKEIKIFSVEEEKAFIKSLSTHRHRALFILVLGTGLRIGEVTSLRWHNINFDTGELRVEKTFKRVQLINSTSKNKTAIIEQEPKTVNSKGTVPIPTSIITELKKHKIRQDKEILEAGEAYVNNDLVFSNQLGEPLDAHNLSRSYRRALAKANIPYKNFHAMRHTFATRLFEEDVPLKTSSAAFGSCRYIYYSEYLYTCNA